MKPKRVLFVCVENSCRSQIAEAFARFHGRGVLVAQSAGSKPSGQVNPTAIEVMAEKGVNLATHASKSLKDVGSEGWDFVITMGCGDACPFVPAVARLDWEIPDPKGKPLEDFRETRDEIERRVKNLIDELKHGS